MFVLKELIGLVNVMLKLAIRDIQLNLFIYSVLE